VLIGPDNGLLLPAALRLGPITAAVELEPAPLPLPTATPPGATFAGRDVFAPAAGRASRGTPVHQLGRPIDPATLAGETVPEPADAGDFLEVEVLWIDRFGNAQINATPRHTGPGPLGLQLSGHPPINTRIVSSYGAIAPDAVALVVDSYGYLSVCSDRRSAAADLGLRPGDRVHLSRDASRHR
jgi:hypothetical protein